LTSLLNCPKCHSVKSITSFYRVCRNCGEVFFTETCPKCGSRDFWFDENRKVCKICHSFFYISGRVKKAFPSEEVKEVLRKADEWRKKAVYEKLKGVVMQSDREFISQMVEGSLLVFRLHSGFLDLRGDEVYFVGRVQISEVERVNIEILTDVSVEEYKLYLASDPERKKQIKLTPHNPYNIYVSFLREYKRNKVNHLVEVGADINFYELTAEVRIDGGDSFCVRYPFPKKDIVKLQRRENKYRSKGEREKREHVKRIATEKTKRTYTRFIEEVHKQAREKLKLKTNRGIKYIWRIENPHILRNLHSQWTMQGWRPTLLKNTLNEKAKHIFLEIEIVKPQYTSVTCNKCGKIHNREGEMLKCECGEVIDWQRNAAKNILNRSTPKRSEVGCLPQSYTR